MARSLGELKGLRELVIVIAPSANEKSSESVMPRDSGASNIRLLRRNLGKARGWKREGVVAEVMLRVEKKMLAEMVVGMRGLRMFRLEGFVDGDFARGLRVVEM